MARKTKTRKHTRKVFSDTRFGRGILRILRSLGVEVSISQGGEFRITIEYDEDDTDNE